MKKTVTKAELFAITLFQVPTVQKVSPVLYKAPVGAKHVAQCYAVTMFRIASKVITPQEEHHGAVYILK